MVALGFPKDVADRIESATDDDVRRLRAPPKEELCPEYAYGYNGKVRRNLFECGVGTGGAPKYLYNVAALAVVFDVVDNTQEFFTGHTTEVSALAFCKATGLCATGQRIGIDHLNPLSPKERPRICVWSVSDRRERLRLHGDHRSVDLLEFSADGMWLFSVSSDRPDISGPSMFSPRNLRSSRRDLARLSPGPVSEMQQQWYACKSGPVHSKTAASIVSVWNLEAAYSQSTANGCRVQIGPWLQLTDMSMHVMGLVHNPTRTEELLCFGSISATFLSCQWRVALSPNAVDIRRPTYHDQRLADDAIGFTAGAYVPGADIALLGTEAGVVLVYDSAADGGRCVQRFEVVPGVPVRVLEWASSSVLTAGGFDCGLSFFRYYPHHGAGGHFELQHRCPLCEPGGQPMLPNAVQASELPDGGFGVMVGTTGGEIVRIDITGDQAPEFSVVQKTPWKDVYAMASHPIVRSRFVIGSTDGQVLFYDTRYRQMMRAPYQCQAPVRSLAWNADGTILACGLDIGFLELVLTLGWDTPGLTAPPPQFLLTTQVLQPMASGEPNAVTDVRFTPTSGEQAGDAKPMYLACGSRDGHIAVYCVEKDGSKILTGGSRITIRKQRVLTGNSSGVLNMQMSVDGRELCCNSKDGKVLAWDLATGERKAPADAFWCRDNHKFQLTMAWQTLGIWNSDTYDASDSLVAESDHDCRVLAVGDIHGVVKLHRFPVPITHAQSRDYRGHCSRVTNICWTSDNDREQLLTVGAGRADCVIQWRLTGTTTARLSPGRQWWAVPPKTDPPIAVGPQVVLPTDGKDGPDVARAGVQTSSDPGRCAGVQTTTDPGRCAGVQTSTDPGRSAAVQTTRDPRRSAGVNASLDAGQSTSMNTSLDAGRSAGVNTSLDAGRSAVVQISTDPGRSGATGHSSPIGRIIRTYGAHPSIDAGRSTGAQTSADAGRAAGVQASTDSRRSMPFAASASGNDAPLQRSIRSLSPARIVSPSRSIVLPATDSLGGGVPSGATSGGDSPPARSVRSLSPTRLVSPRRSSTPGGSLRITPVRADTRPVSSSLSLPMLPAVSDTSSLSARVQKTRSARTPSPPRTARKAEPAAILPITALTMAPSLECNFKVRVLDAQNNKVLSHAIAYLYAPPFGLTGLVDFVKAAPEGEPAELFTPPKGWGVVRSRSGLVLWLNMILDRAQEAEFVRVADAPRTGTYHLRVEFSTSSGLCSHISATIIGHFSARAPLLPDEGLLHPSAGQRLRVRFMQGFDHELKMWLSHHLYSSGFGTSTQ